MSDDFYRTLPIGSKNGRQFGQIVWVPAPIISNGILSLRLPVLKAGEDVKSVPLMVMRIAANDFGNLTEQEKANIKVKMPMPELGLALSEELTIVKAKIRPAVIIQHDCLNWRKEAQFIAKATSKPVNPNRHLFAPVYSLKKDDGSTDYPDAFIDKVKQGDYPHIMFLPAYRSPIKNDSMLVFSDMFQAGLATVDATELSVDPETLALHFSEWSDFFAERAMELGARLDAEPPKKC